MLWQRLRNAPRKYRNEIGLSLFSAAVGVLFSNFFDSVLKAPSVDQIHLGLLCALFAFVAGLAFMIRRNVIVAIGSLSTRVSDMTGRRVPSMYGTRKLHFAIEKSRLVEFLVRSFLPENIAKLLKDPERQLAGKKIALIVDSGTTLEAFFSRVKIFGFGHDVSEDLAKNINIYTNSLSGSNAFCEEPANALNEDQIRLFGGTQIEKYKAVLGKITLLGLDAVLRDYRGGGGVTIGIATANWFLVGRSYDRLVLCSAEQGHLEYKRAVAEGVDLLIVVSPLAKLLRFEDLSELNTALQLREQGEPEYSGFNISDVSGRNKTNTLLLTTHRSWKKSILLRHSEELYSQSAKYDLYTICPRRRYLALDHRMPYEDQLDVEMPHGYLRDHASTAFQLPGR